MESQLKNLLEMMARLRDPEFGCPWDNVQTFRSLIPFIIEETYEVVGAIEQDNFTNLAEELGDLLYQIVFLSKLAEEQGLFDFSVVLNGIVKKLKRRHPHVFKLDGDNIPQPSEAVWEKIKTQERTENRQANNSENCVLDDLTHALPALIKTEKIQKRVASVGFDWENLNQVIEKVEEELGELKQVINSEESKQRFEHEVGDLMLAVTNVARFAGVSPEDALRLANDRFTCRFRKVEYYVRQENLNLGQLTSVEIDLLWERAKAELNEK